MEESSSEAAPSAPDVVDAEDDASDDTPGFGLTRPADAPPLTAPARPQQMPAENSAATGHVGETQPMESVLHLAMDAVLVRSAPQFTESGHLTTPAHTALLEVARNLFNALNVPLPTERQQIGGLLQLLHQGIPYEDEAKGSFNLVKLS